MPREAGAGSCSAVNVPPFWPHTRAGGLNLRKGSPSFFRLIQKTQKNLQTLLALEQSAPDEGRKVRKNYSARHKAFAWLVFLVLNLAWTKKWLSTVETKWKLSFWVKQNVPLDWRYLLPFSHYSGKIFQVNTEHLLFFFKWTEKPITLTAIPAVSRLLCSWGTLWSCQHNIREKIKLYFSLCVLCSCREESEPHLAKLNLPLDPTVVWPCSLDTVQVKLRSFTLIFSVK